jgi:hypothetical protein
MRETTQVFQQMAHNQYEPLPKWAGSRLPDLPAAAPRRLQEPNESLLVLAEKTLQRVQVLQTMLEETRTELHHIETLIHRAAEERSRRLKPAFFNAQETQRLNAK